MGTIFFTYFKVCYEVFVKFLVKPGKTTILMC